VCGSTCQFNKSSLLAFEPTICTMHSSIIKAAFLTALSAAAGAAEATLWNGSANLRTRFHQLQGFHLLQRGGISPRRSVRVRLRPHRAWQHLRRCRVSPLTFKSAPSSVLLTGHTDRRQEPAPATAASSSSPTTALVAVQSQAPRFRRRSMISAGMDVPCVGAASLIMGARSPLTMLRLVRSGALERNSD
jgi:hypothetical protein